MTKRTRLLALLGFLSAIGAVGALQVFTGSNSSKRDSAPEKAADAVAGAATAALDWTQDRGERSVEVVLLMGQSPHVASIRALLVMQGGSRLSAVCASLPRIHDAINILMFDKVRVGLAGGQAGDGVELASFETPLKDLLNRSYEEPTIDQVRLSHGNAAMGDFGCTEKNARREKADKPQDSARH